MEHQAFAPQDPSAGPETKSLRAHAPNPESDARPALAGAAPETKSRRVRAPNPESGEADARPTLGEPGFPPGGPSFDSKLRGHSPLDLELELADELARASPADSKLPAGGATGWPPASYAEPAGQPAGGAIGWPPASYAEPAGRTGYAGASGEWYGGYRTYTDDYGASDDEGLDAGPPTRASSRQLWELTIAINDLALAVNRLSKTSEDQYRVISRLAENLERRAGPAAGPASAEPASRN
jgi:hypothetical protein